MVSEGIVAGLQHVRGAVGGISDQFDAVGCRRPIDRLRQVALHRREPPLRLEVRAARRESAASVMPSSTYRKIAASPVEPSRRASHLLRAYSHRMSTVPIPRRRHSGCTVPCRYAWSAASCTGCSIAQPERHDRAVGRDGDEQVARGVDVRELEHVGDLLTRRHPRRMVMAIGCHDRGVHRVDVVCGGGAEDDIGMPAARRAGRHRAARTVAWDTAQRSPAEPTPGLSHRDRTVRRSRGNSQTCGS